MLYLLHCIFLSIRYTFLSFFFFKGSYKNCCFALLFFFHMKGDVKYFMYIYTYISLKAQVLKKKKKKRSQLFSIFKGKLKSTEIVVQFPRVRLRYQC